VQAEEFNEAVQVVRDWLPQSEAELKFRAITEDEEGILQLIENHEVLIAVLTYNLLSSSSFVRKRHKDLVTHFELIVIFAFIRRQSFGLWFIPRP